MRRIDLVLSSSPSGGHRSVSLRGPRSAAFLSGLAVLFAASGSPAAGTGCGSGSPCTQPSAIGGCSDATCCESVCAVMIQCCEVAWDSSCVSLTASVCGMFDYQCNTGPNAPANDCAPSAASIAFDQTVAFSTVNAGTDGPPVEACSQGKDIWFLVGALDPGDIDIEVVTPGFDSTISLYDVGWSAEFNPSFLPQYHIRCIDQMGAGGESARLSEVQPFRFYLVRVAGFNGQSGTGTIRCTFRQYLFDTGRSRPVLYDATNQGNLALVNLGWSSGNLAAGSPQRWSAQGFRLGVPGDGKAWAVTSVQAFGFTPVGVQNPTLGMRIWHRHGVSNPNGELMVLGTTVPFPVPYDLPGGLANELHEIDLSGAPPVLLSGDYWLTVYAESPNAPNPPANFVWLTNAPFGVDNLDPITLEPRMWRSMIQPNPGFMVYNLPPTTLAQQPGLDPNDLYSAAFRIVGYQVQAPVPECPFDFNNNGVVDGADLGLLLAAGGTGVEIGQLLGAWGPCPTE